MFLMISLSAFRQEDTTFLKNWKNYPVPKDEKTIVKYNSVPNDWFVYFDGDEIRVDDVRYKRRSKINELPFKLEQSNGNIIGITPPFAEVRDVVEVDDGYLAGFNGGEWGGELHWFSKNGKERYKISGHQIAQFIKRDNKVYAIEGLSHLGMSRGSIIEIEKKHGKWAAKEFLKLPAAPNAVQLDSKDNFIVVTSSSLLSVDKNVKINTLIKNGMWNIYLYPSSMVIQNDVVYIGMRKGVYKFDLTTKKDEWLLPE